MVSNGSPVWWGEGTAAELQNDLHHQQAAQPVQAPIIEITDPNDFLIERRRPSFTSIEFPDLKDSPPPYEFDSKSNEQLARNATQAHVALCDPPKSRRRAISTASASVPSSRNSSRSRSTSAPESPRSSSPARGGSKPDDHSIAVGMGMSTVAAMAVGIGYVK